MTTAGKIVCVKGDPTKVAFDLVAEVSVMKFDHENETDYGDGPALIGKDGKIVKNFATTLIELVKGSILEPLDENEKKQVTTKVKDAIGFAKTLVTDTDYAESKPRVTKLKETVSDTKLKLNEIYSFIKRNDDYLIEATYLASEKLSICDLFIFAAIYPLVQAAFDEKFLSTHFPHLSRWLDLVLNQKEGVSKIVKSAGIPSVPAGSWPELQSFISDKLSATLTTTISYKFNLTDWKTIYSSESPEASTKWFWENFVPEEFAAYRVDYKFSTHLTSSLIAKNLILGFFQRIEPAAKTSTGFLLVLGTPGNFHVKGYILFRGDEIHPSVTSSPDFDSFTFTPVDITKPDVKPIFNSYLAWADIVEGLPCIDGKTFQ